MSRPYAISGAVRSQDRADLLEFLDALAARGRAVKTQRTYVQAAEGLAHHAATRGWPALVGLERSHIEEYLSHLRGKGNRPGTLRNRYAGLVQFFRWAVSTDARPDDPMQRIEPPRYPETVQADYALEEIARLFKAMNGSRLLDLRDRAIVALLYDTGLRGQELCDVRVGDVDRETRRILIRSGKAGKQRLVGYSYESATHLNRYVRRRSGWETLDPDAPLLVGHRDAPLTTDALRLMMGRRFAVAGLTFRGLHAFRRGWAIAYLDAGGDPLALKELAGWASLSMLHRYTKRTAQERALRAVDQFSPMARLNQRRLT